MANDNGHCQLCGNPWKNSKDCHLDHSHKTGKLRGLVCRRCNVSLGQLEENIELFGKMVLYLQKNSPVQPLEGFIFPSV